jgi:hypothetical protein
VSPDEPPEGSGWEDLGILAVDMLVLVSAVLIVFIWVAELISRFV